MYSPVQASSTEDGGIATVYVSDTVTNQLTEVAEKPSLELPRNSITIGSVFMEGTFGSIFHAKIEQPGISRDVIVKTVKSNLVFNGFSRCIIIIIDFIFRQCCGNANETYGRRRYKISGPFTPQCLPVDRHCRRGWWKTFACLSSCESR